MKKSTALILVPLIMVFCLTTPKAEAKAGEIHLKSRKWTPLESTDESETAEIERMRKGVNRVHGLLRLHHIPDQKEKVDLEKSGILLLEYIPENGYLISISGKTEIHKESLAQIQWIGPLAPVDKIEPNLREQGIGPWARLPDGRIMLRITYFRDVTAEEAKATLSTMGITLLKEAPDFHYIEIATEENQIMKIAQQDEVQWIEEVPPPAVPHNNGSRANTGAETVQTAHYNLSGAGVVVGQWDVGNVDSTHDDFGTPSRVTVADNVGVTGNHATHVAGTLGGGGLRSGGTYKGTAPGIKIFSYDFSSGFTPSAHNGAINTYGIELSNNSWGHDVALTPYNNCNLYGDYSNDAPSFDRIVTGLYGKRISIIFSAGNERDDNDCPTLGTASGYPYYANIPPPATAKNVITVGAINSDDSTMTGYSGWGPMDDGRIKPEVVAPGDEAGGDGGINSTIPVDAYDVMVGTSMAAPAVSGSAALIIEDYRRIHGGMNPLPSTVKALMVHSAQDLGNTGPDFSFGYGKIDVKNAIDLLRSGSVIEDEVGHQSSNFFYLEVPTDTSSVKVTLVWDDEAAANNAAITLVNDLDLIVRGPNQDRYYPWTLDPNNPSIPAVRIVADHRNNVEQVEVSGTLSPGTWTVEVHGFAVPVKAPQKYSLIFTPVLSMLGVSVSPNEAVFASADVPKSIPSGSPGATSLLTIPGDMIIVGTRVYVDISKPSVFCCFYKITLTSPAGTPVILYDSANNSTAFQTWFDTQTVTVEPLSRFVGESTRGTWSLNVIDNLPDNSAIINNWSIEILTRSWAIGTAVSGATMTMMEGDRFIVKNVGNTSETFTMHVSDTGGSWSAASAESGNGVDTFVMSGLFSSATDTSPGSADFNTLDSDDVIPSSYSKAATSTDFAGDAMTQNGVNVPPGSSRALYLQFKTPTGTTVLGSQRIVVTVGAMPP